MTHYGLVTPSRLKGLLVSTRELVTSRISVTAKTESSGTVEFKLSEERTIPDESIFG